jgi:hypothetical protein
MLSKRFGLSNFVSSSGATVPDSRKAAVANPNKANAIATMREDYLALFGLLGINSLRPIT